MTFTPLFINPPLPTEKPHSQPDGYQMMNRGRDKNKRRKNQKVTKKKE